MPRLEDSEIEQRLQGSAWSREGDALVLDYEFPDFAAAIAFVNEVARIAEELGHHPDILVHGWNKVRLTLSTHTQGGITDSDFGLAARIDALSANSSAS